MQLPAGLLLLQSALQDPYAAADDLSGHPAPSHFSDAELEAGPGEVGILHGGAGGAAHHNHATLLLATLLVLAAVYPLKLLVAWAGTAATHRAGTAGRSHRATNHQQQRRNGAGSPDFTFPATAARREMQPGHRTRTPQTDRPFRFRAPDLEPDSDADVAATVQPQAPHTAPSFRVSKRARQAQGGTPAAVSARSPQQQQQPEENAGGWDAELLQRCAANQAFITSEQALQRSPLFVDHIRSARGKQLSYERRENHKLRVYRALREVDPSSFQRLFTRTDIKEYDEVPPSRWQVLLDGLVSTAATWACLALPRYLAAPSSSSSHWQLGALAWLVTSLWALSAGCTSCFAWLLNTHATYGPHANLASTWRLLVAVVAEAALVALLPGCWGVLLAVLWRLCSAERQGCGEWLVKITPLREVVRPMHFSPLPPASSARGWYGATGDDEDVQARLFDD